VPPCSAEGVPEPPSIGVADMSSGFGVAVTAVNQDDIETYGVGVGLSMGRELESVGGRVVMTDVLGAVVAGRHDVDAAWSLLWEVGVQRQGGLYTRTGATLGIRRRF